MVGMARGIIRSAMATRSRCRKGLPRIRACSRPLQEKCDARLAPRTAGTAGFCWLPSVRWSCWLAGAAAVGAGDRRGVARGILDLVLVGRQVRRLFLEVGRDHVGDRGRVVAVLGVVGLAGGLDV